MACELATVQAALCGSGIGKETDLIRLLQIVAQNLADTLPDGTDISVEAILERACESGIGKVIDEITLLKIIAQNLCDATP